MDYTAFFILACIFIPVERLLPLMHEQGVFRPEQGADVSYPRLDSVVFTCALAIVVALIMVVFTSIFGTEPIPLVAVLPLWIQVLALIAIADIGRHSAHSMSRGVPFQWRLRAVHHRNGRSDHSAGSRVHPVDQILSNTLLFLPIYFLGFSLEAVAIFQMLCLARSVLGNFRHTKQIQSCERHRQ